MFLGFSAATAIALTVLGVLVASVEYRRLQAAAIREITAIGELKAHQIER
jgi:hypothetical protein